MSRPVVVVALFAVLAGTVVTFAAGAGGGTLWTSRFDGPAQGSDYGLWEATSPDGTKVFVAGRTRSGSTPKEDVLTLAYNAATGAKLWAARYNGPANGVDTAHVVAASADGTKVFTAGQAYTGSTSGMAYVTIAYDAATGAQLWASRYNGPVNGFDSIYGIASSPDGAKVYVTGRSYQGASKGEDVVTIAYNAANGTKAWTAVYNGVASLNDGGHALTLSGDGTRVFVAGYTSGSSSNQNFLTVAYNAATGAKLWDRSFSGPGNHADTAYSVAASPTKVFVTGTSYGGDVTLQDLETVAYNATTGVQSWASRYNGPAGLDDYGSAVAISDDGSKVFATGMTNAGATNGYDYLTLGYNGASGAKLWSTRYNGTGSDYDAAYSITGKGDGTKVFVTGESLGTNALGDYATLAYNGSGGKLWAARYDGPAHSSDYANFAVLSPDETRLFVTGGSISTHSDDAVTIAYQP